MGLAGVVYKNVNGAEARACSSESSGKSCGFGDVRLNVLQLWIAGPVRRRSRAATKHSNFRAMSGEESRHCRTDSPRATSNYGVFVSQSS